MCVCVCVDWINSLVIVLILMWSSTGHATNKSFYAKIIVWRIRNWTLMASRNVSLSSNYKNINLNQGMNRKNKLVQWNSCRLCLEKYTICSVWFERKKLIRLMIDYWKRLFQKAWAKFNLFQNSCRNAHKTFYCFAVIHFTSLHLKVFVEKVCLLSPNEFHFYVHSLEWRIEFS